jgi:hypothetical protein
MGDVRRLPGVEQLAMAGLSVAEVAQLMSQAAGHALDDEGRRLAESLHAETEGNPLLRGGGASPSGRDRDSEPSR